MSRDCRCAPSPLPLVTRKAWVSIAAGAAHRKRAAEDAALDWTCRASRGSIRLEAVPRVVTERRVLVFLPQHEIADNQKIDLAPHEAMEGVLGRAHNRLAAHVEACIDEHRTAGKRF